MLYGAVFRIYYTPAKPHMEGKLSLCPNQALCDHVVLTTQIEGNASAVSEVVYWGKYADYNYQGDGNFRHWQYHYLKGEMVETLGSSGVPPFEVVWNTEWVPANRSLWNSPPTSPTNRASPTLPLLLED